MNLGLEMVNIIILTYNKIEFTKNCLEYLKRNTSYENWRVVIVDNGSSDGTIEYLETLRETYPKEIYIIKNHKNLGYSRGCNIGARGITNGYLLLLNNDVYVCPNWLQNMINCMEKEEKRAIIGAKLIFPKNQRIQHAGVTITPNGKPFHQYRNFNSNHPKVNIERAYPAVTAACLLIKTEIFRLVKGFDEKYVLGSFEDVDLCLKVYHLGYKIIYCPTAVGIHYEKTTSHQIPNYDSVIMPRNLQKFLKKWFPTSYAKIKLVDMYSSLIKRNLKNICNLFKVPQTFLNFYPKIREKSLAILKKAKTSLSIASLDQGEYSAYVMNEKEVGEVWSHTYTHPPSTRARWWQCPTILRHINKRVYGKEIDGLHQGFYELVKKKFHKYLPFPLAISVGCGEAIKELKLINQGIVQKFDLFDISEEGIKRGKQRAKDSMVSERMSFYLGDAFKLADKPNKYDLIFWNNALHHMPDAKKAVKWSKRVLKKKGVFLMDDFVGPSQMQWSDKMLEINTRIRCILLEKYLCDPNDATKQIPRIMGRPNIKEFLKIDSSECADSSNILKSIKKYFPNAEIRYTGGYVYHLALSDVLHNIKEEEDKNDKVLLDLLLLIDDLCIELGETQYAIAIAQKK